MTVHIFLRGLFFCFLSISVYGDWNEEFHEKTKYLIECFPQLQKEPYRNSYQNFLHDKQAILKNTALKKKISSIAYEEKEVFLDISDKVVIKKRRNENIYELFAWEVACLFGSSDHLLPAFPIEIEGKKAILQAKKHFVYGKGKLNMLPLSIVNTVSMQTYWKAHLSAYLLGIVDLVAKNIGVGEKGKVLFFDAEMCFSYHNTQSSIKPGFTIGFVAESFDWPQYKKPLDRKTARLLQEYVASLANIEESLKLYEELREVSIIGEGLAYRLEKVRSFAFSEGQSFKDFFSFICPKLAPGLDKLSRQVGEILNQKVGHGAALIFMNRKIDQYPISASQRKSIEKWIDTYID